MEKIQRTGEFDASPEAVFAVISEPEFQQRKAEAQSGLPGATGTVTTEGGGIRVETLRVIPTDKLPDFVTSVVGKELRISETQVWGGADEHGSRTGTVTASVHGAPVALSGTLSLTAAGAGSVEKVDGQLKADIFLVGSRVEKAAAPFLTQALDAEFDLIRERLQN